MKYAALLVLVLLTGGCAGKNVDTSMLAAGSAIKTVGNQFVAAEMVYQTNCRPIKPGFKQFCMGLYTFAPKFKAAYNPAVDTWNTAASANDASKALGAQATILQLSVELAAVLASVLQEVH
jgi:hypothetical protein